MVSKSLFSILALAATLLAAALADAAPSGKGSKQSYPLPEPPKGSKPPPKQGSSSKQQSYKLPEPPSPKKQIEDHDKSMFKKLPPIKTGKGKK
ncbi:hypothetical protein DFJ73DRAFT_875164 [Zopfochytrium polystomum]|nr:hypothetical protein DFJ73DRAFT_875164 [Zopfochytrium polystomum]